MGGPKPKHTKALVQDVAALQEKVLRDVLELVSSTGYIRTYQREATTIVENKAVSYMKMLDNINERHHERALLLPTFIRARQSIDTVMSRVAGLDVSNAKAIIDVMFQPFWAAVPKHLRPDNVYEATDAGNWTGVRTAAQKAAGVLAYAPIAIAALEQLIAHEELRLHNQRGSPEVEEALQALEMLRNDIEDLLASVRAGQPINKLLNATAAKFKGLFNYSRGMMDVSVKNVELGVASAIPAACTIFAIEKLIGTPMDFAGTATVMAGYVAGASAIAKAKRK